MLLAALVPADKEQREWHQCGLSALWVGQRYNQWSSASSWRSTGFQRGRISVCIPTHSPSPRLLLIPLSEDVFLWLRSGIKSGLLVVPAPSLSFTREGVKKACSPDPRQAAASYPQPCPEQMWSGHFQKRIWETKISAALSQIKQTFARASTNPANGQSGLKTPQTSLEQGALISSETRTCRCTQPTLGCSEEKAMGLGKPLEPKGGGWESSGLPDASK